VTAVVLLLAVTLLLTASRVVPADLAALIPIPLLVLSGALPPGDAFSSFSSPALVLVSATYIVTEALRRTGPAALAGQFVRRVGGSKEGVVLPLLMALAACMSAFMSNIGAASSLMPAVVRVGQRTRIPPSRLLMPMTFGALLGGTLTLVGTAPNILASETLRRAGYRELGLFELAPLGAVLLLAGIVYMVLIGRLLLPKRQPLDRTQAYGLHPYLTEVLVLPTSPLVGRTIQACRFREEFDISLLGIVRGGKTMLSPGPGTVLEERDLLLVEAEVASMLKIKDTQGLEILSDVKIREVDLKDPAVGLEEAILAPNAELIGRTIKGLNFHRRFGVTVIAIRHLQTKRATKLSQVRLQFGDSLLLQGHRERFAALRRDPNFLALERVTQPVTRWDHAVFTVLVLGTLVLASLLGRLSVTEAWILGAVALLVYGCVRTEEAYRAIHWRTVFLLAGWSTLALALDRSGAAAAGAEVLVQQLSGVAPHAVLALVFTVAALLSQTLSPVAVVLLLGTIAVPLAVGLGLSPRPFLVALAVAPSSALLSPFSHRVNLLIWGPGNYRFWDYSKVGIPLSLLLGGLVLVLVPLHWPF